MVDEISETGEYRGFYIIPYTHKFRACLKPFGKSGKLFSTPDDAAKAIDGGNYEKDDRNNYDDVRIIIKLPSHL